MMKGYKMFCCYFSLAVLLETNYLRMYGPDLHQMFRMGMHVGEHDLSDLFAMAERT